MDIHSLDPPLLARNGGSTLTEQLAARFADRIRQRLIAPGARLPSVRECARRHRVSACTVVAAYDQLVAQGLVEARRQRGFFARGIAPQPATRDEQPKALLPIDATTLIRGMFQRPSGKPMPGLGTLPADWLDMPLLGAALRKVTSGDRLEALTAFYGEPAGDQRLRNALSVQLQEFDVHARGEQIVTTVGATHALDVVTRTLARPGDCVLVDDPGWSVEYARLRALGMRLLPVPRGEEGPDIDAMQALARAYQPRLYITVSVLHNPTGASLPLRAAHRVLTTAREHGITIVEDDTYARLAPHHLPRLAALDGLEHTVYVSGFSKILAPNWRVGFIAAPPHLVERLIDTKLLTTLTTPSITEQALAYCFEQGSIRRHAERVAGKLDAARTRCVQLARAAGCRFAAEPRGLFGWVDVGVDTDRLAQVMLDDGWLLAPGSLFHASPRPTSLMRINFATTQDARFWTALDLARQRV